MGLWRKNTICGNQNRRRHVPLRGGEREAPPANLAAAGERDKNHSLSLSGSHCLSVSVSACCSICYVLLLRVALASAHVTTSPPPSQSSVFCLLCSICNRAVACSPSNGGGLSGRMPVGPVGLPLFSEWHVRAALLFACCCSCSGRARLHCVSFSISFTLPVAERGMHLLTYLDTHSLFHFIIHSLTNTC